MILKGCYVDLDLKCGYISSSVRLNFNANSVLTKPDSTI